MAEINNNKTNSKKVLVLVVLMATLLGLMIQSWPMIKFMVPWFGDTPSLSSSADMGSSLSGQMNDEHFVVSSVDETTGQMTLKAEAPSITNPPTPLHKQIIHESQILHTKVEQWTNTKLELKAKQEALALAKVDDQLNELTHKQNLREIELAQKRWSFDDQKKMQEINIATRKKQTGISDKRKQDDQGMTSSSHNHDEEGNHVNKDKVPASTSKRGQLITNGKSDQNNNKNPVAKEVMIPKLIGLLSQNSAVFSLDNNQFVLQIGESYQGIALTKIAFDKEQVTVKINKNTYTLSLLAMRRIANQPTTGSDHTH